MMRDGAPLFYTTHGEGPAVILLHGYTGDHRVWEALVPALARDFRVIVPDLPGCGQSAVPPEPSIPGMAAAVVALLDELAVDRATVVGHSMGGYTALEMLARTPERLTALGLLHSHPYAQLSDEEPRHRQRSIAFMERHGAALYVKQLIPTLFAPDYTHRLELEKQSYRALETPTAGLIACQRAMLHRTDHTTTLVDSPVPVLQLHGRHDALIPTGTQESMSVLATDTTVHWLNGAGHFGMVEDSKLTGRLLRRFLARTP